MSSTVETIRGYQVEPGDRLVNDDGSVVDVLETWIDGGQMHMRYRCDNGDVLDMVVHGGLSQRRVLP